MSQEILVPFALDQNGNISSTSDPDIQVQQHINSLISTTPGERVMQPQYGVSLSSRLFGEGADIVSTMVVNDVRQAINKYEPSVNILSITPIASVSEPTQGIVAVEVDYTVMLPRSTNPATTVATILPGGLVVES